MLSLISNSNGTIVLRVFLQYSAPLGGSDRSVLILKINETASKKPQSPEVQKRLNKCCCMYVAS